MKGDDQTYLMM